MKDENDFSIGFGVNDDEENDETRIAEIEPSQPLSKSKSAFSSSSSSSSASDKSSTGNDDDDDDDDDDEDDDATSTTEDSPTANRQSSSCYSDYNWRHYMTSHSNRWHFFRWSGGSVFC
jgi:hypothetical protein